MERGTEDQGWAWVGQELDFRKVPLSCKLEGGCGSLPSPIQLSPLPAHSYGPEAGTSGRGSPAGLPPCTELLHGFHGRPEPLSAVSARWGWLGLAGESRGSETRVPWWATRWQPHPGLLFGPTVCQLRGYQRMPPTPCTSSGKMRRPGEGMQLRPWESDQVKLFPFLFLAAGCVTSEEAPKPSEFQSSPFSEKGSGPTSYEWSEVARDRAQRQVCGKCSCLSCSPALQHLGLFMCSYSSHGAPPSQKRKPMRTGWEMGRSNHQSAIMWVLVQPHRHPVSPGTSSQLAARPSSASSSTTCGPRTLSQLCSSQV